MKLVIIGSGSSVIRLDRHAPAFLLDTGKQLILLDCGWGCGENLVRAGYSVNKIDHIFITHPHADHLGNLISLLHHMLNSGHFSTRQRRTKPLFLHGYKGFSKDYESLRRIMFPERAERYEIKIFEYLNTARMFPGFKVISAEAQHVPEYFRSVSYRLEVGKTSTPSALSPQSSALGNPDFGHSPSGRGRVIFYSGDSGYTKQLVKLAQNADLALLEASVPPRMYRKMGPRPNHLSALECGLIASRAGVKKLALVHQYDNDRLGENRREVKKNYKGSLFMTKDLMKIDV